MLPTHCLLVLTWPYLLLQSPAVPSSAPQSIEDEVIGNIQSQSVGSRTLADDRLPQQFLSRVADRIIRQTFEERYRLIISDADADKLAGAPQPTATTLPGRTAAAPSRTPPVASGPVVRIVRPDLLQRVLDYRSSLPEGRPPLRGFRAPVLNHSDPPWPLNEPRATAPEPMRRAAALVGQRLAVDGLLATTAAALAILEKDTPGLSHAALLDQLKHAGIPVDLLVYFTVPAADRTSSQPSAAEQTAAWLRARRATDPAAARPDLAAVRFTFVPSIPGFRVATESGEHDIGLVRLQLTRGTDWAAEGDGGSLDIARQLARLLPDASFVISIEARHLTDFLTAAQTGPFGAAARRLTVIPEPLTVAQWAQDNGKPGIVIRSGQWLGPSGQNANPDSLITNHQSLTTTNTTLVPRFATRGEDGATFVPGESFLADGLAAAGLRVDQSPLLFQGGDLLGVREPATGERILLIGEANIHRNVALGLTAAQVLDAFRIEFGVDRCVVFPAVSFHIDYELTVRAIGNRLTAFVNDPTAAARLIVACGIDVLKSKGRLGPESARAAREHLQAGRDAACLALIGPAVTANSPGPGLFRESFAHKFSTGPADSGVGSLQHLLLAMDWLAALSMSPQEQRGSDHAAAYARAIHRQVADRKHLTRQLGAMGCRAVSVPSFGDGRRSLNYLNGIQARSMYLMPAYGGLLTPVDDAVAAVFEREMGPGIKVIRVICSESQRRDGALHCSASVIP